jgi:hypothetical protein
MGNVMVIGGTVWALGGDAGCRQWSVMVGARFYPWQYSLWDVLARWLGKLGVTVYGFQCGEHRRASG